jgi:hypothetical protein
MYGREITQGETEGKREKGVEEGMKGNRDKER